MFLLCIWSSYILYMELNLVSKSRQAVSQYLLFYPNNKTQTNYHNAIYQYFCTLYSDVPPETDGLDILAADYLDKLKEGRNPVADLRLAANKFNNKYSPMTVHLNLTLVCAWMEYCGISLQKRERQRIFSSLPPARPIRREAELTRTMFRKLYAELPGHVGVLLLVLLGSGMRIGEALALQKSDLDGKLKRTAIHIRAETTKTKTARTIYLTTEATCALMEYLSMRTDNDGRIFPYSQASAQYYFRKAVDRLGYGKKGNTPRMIHWHMTRKWFISRFSLYASKEVAEELAGHEGYLSQSYQRFTRKQILYQFKRADNYLSLFPDNVQGK